MLKKVIPLFFILLLAIKSLSAQEILDQILAIVDDKVILKSELEQFSITMALQLGIDIQKEPEKLEKLRQETLNKMIVEKVLLSKAREDSIIVTEKQVEAKLEEQIQLMVQQIGSEEKVAEHFGMSVRQVKREFRNEVEERMVVQLLRQKKDFETQITRREIEQFYHAYRDSLPEVKESIKISHILVAVEPSPEAREVAHKKADEILARLMKGENFAELARQYSEDPGSSVNGGDLGMMQRGDLVREFEEVAFQLEPGEISDIVKSRFGFHIIQLIKKAGEKINPRHILIRLDTSPEDASATVQKLADLKRQILAGEITFEEAAKKYSKDESTANKGGDLGWFPVEEFQLESFKDAVSGLDIGEISDPEKTKFGYHLLRVDDKRPTRKLDVSDDWEQIESWALDLKRRKEFERWVEEIKKDVYVEVKG